MSDDAALAQQQQQQHQLGGGEDEELEFRMQVPILDRGAQIITQALDFGKQVVGTARKLTLQAPSEEQQRRLSAQLGFDAALLCIVVTAPNARLLRTGVYGTLEQIELSMRTLEMFAPGMNAAASSSDAGAAVLVPGTGATAARAAAAAAMMGARSSSSFGSGSAAVKQSPHLTAHEPAGFLPAFSIDGEAAK
jgi:hypothetical protein